MVVYGHTPVAEPEWLNRTIDIDTGCVFGGKLIFPDVAPAAVAVKGIRFAAMNAVESGAPLTVILTAAVFQLREKCPLLMFHMPKATAPSHRRRGEVRRRSTQRRGVVGLVWRIRRCVVGKNTIPRLKLGGTRDSNRT